VPCATETSIRAPYAGIGRGTGVDREPVAPHADLTASRGGQRVTVRRARPTARRTAAVVRRRPVPGLLPPRSAVLTVIGITPTRGRTDVTDVADNGGRNVHQRSDHPIYVELQETPEFGELRRRFRAFVFPATVAFLAWYLLYVVLSNWANDFMSTDVVGNVNVALVFGLLQFASTFLIAIFYARYMNRRVDPLARQLEKRFDDETGLGGVAR
jgi:uncharacterized membrane protein (DUF485 family)